MACTLHWRIYMNTKYNVVVGMYVVASFTSAILANIAARDLAGAYVAVVFS